MCVIRRLYLLVSLPLFAPGVAAAAEAYGATDFASDRWSAFLGEVFRSVDVVGFVLLAFLLALIGMCVDLFVQLRVGRLIPAGLLGDVQEEMGNGEYEKALELCEKSESLVGQVFSAVLAKTDYSFDRMEEAMRGEVKIQGLVWRQWTRQFRAAAVGGLLLGLVGAIVQCMRFVADMNGRPNIALMLASSVEVRALAYNIFLALALGCIMALLALTAYTAATAKLEKLLLEAERLGEELLDPFRPLPLDQEE